MPASSLVSTEKLEAALPGGPEVNVAMNERLVSLGIGGALLLNSLLGPKRSRPLSMLVAGGLLYRGLTGHCHTYEMLGVDTAQGERATEGSRTTTE